MSELRMSHSSSRLLSSCSRKYYYKKIAKVEVDADVTESTLALDVGKAFHQVLEETDHKRKNFSLEILNNACHDNQIQEPAIKAMIRAMLYKYMILHEKSGLEIVCIEEEIVDEKPKSRRDYWHKKRMPHYSAVELVG